MSSVEAMSPRAMCVRMADRNLKICDCLKVDIINVDPRELGRANIRAWRAFRGCQDRNEERRAQRWCGDEQALRILSRYCRPWRSHLFAKITGDNFGSAAIGQCGGVQIHDRVWGKDQPMTDMESKNG